jgi:hypothetical protein
LFAPFVNSYNRMATALSLFERFPARRLECFSALGEAWSMCDNVSFYRCSLRRLLGSATPQELDAMMSSDERAALAAMPPSFEVWRGCYAINRAGMSWTLDRECAKRFPTLSRYKRPGDQPLLRMGKVRRDRAVLKLDRSEKEVIAPRVYCITETPLTRT